MNYPRLLIHQKETTSIQYDKWRVNYQTRFSNASQFFVKKIYS